MEEETIQPDVSEEEIVADESQAEEEPRSERDEVVDRILAKRSAERDIPDEESEEEEYPEEEPEEPENITVKVDGKEYEVPREEVEKAGGVNAYQMERAARERLRRASEMERVLKQREALLSEAERRMKEQPPQTEAEIDLAEQIVSNMFEDEDKAKAAISQLVKDAKEARELAQSVVQTVQTREQKEQARMQREIQEGRKFVMDEYPEIANDPDLWFLADRKTIEIARANPDYSPMQVIKAAVEDVSRFVRREEVVQDVKRKMPKQPVKAGGRIPQKESKPLTRQDVIAQIQKERGQTV